jgi:hypothetical protein
MTDLCWLQKWCEQQCNGLWEHSSEVKISTLDNPGWAVEIALKGTLFENHRMDEVRNSPWRHRLDQVSSARFLVLRLRRPDEA